MSVATWTAVVVVVASYTVFLDVVDDDASRLWDLPPPLISSSSSASSSWNWIHVHDESEQPQDVVDSGCCCVVVDDTLYARRLDQCKLASWRMNE